MSSVVCEEVFDESTLTPPTAEEIKSYALRIGIDPENEPQLLALANEGLMKPLPPGWKPCYNETGKSFFYYNTLTGKSQWEHPLDEVYRGLVVKVRSETQSLSQAEENNTEDATFNIRDDLPSLEETQPKTPETMGAKKKEFSGGKKPKLSKQKSEEPLGGLNKKQQQLMMFSSFDDEKIEGDGKKIEEAVQKRGILRDRNFLEPSRSMEFDKSSIEKSDRDDDDKKSVRFNLDNTTDALTLSEKSSSDEEKQPAVVIKSRFTVSPVAEPEINATKKIIKPYPKDLITPVLKISKNSDSDDEKNSSDSLSGGERILRSVTHLRAKAERKIDELKQAIWDEKNRELEHFKRDMHESHKKELERVLIEEKQRHEERIKSELESLRKEMENRATGTLRQENERLRAELDNKKLDLEAKYTDFEKTITENFAQQKQTLEKRFADNLKQLEKQLEEKREQVLITHNAILEQLKENHSIIMEELKKEFMAEEHVLRREHQVRMAELRAKIANESTCDEKMFEKLKCERKLLEDKYRCLKDKYLRLKTDVKTSIEKRNKKKEQSGTTTTTTTTTGSETERSHSVNKERTPLHSPSSHRKTNPDKPPTPKSSRSKPDHRTTKQIIIQDLDTSVSDRSSHKNDDYNYTTTTTTKTKDDSSESNNLNPTAGRSRKKLFSRLKSSSTSRINNNVGGGGGGSGGGGKGRKSQRSCSPVENLRRQLQKLEDLEDQIPQSAQADAYHLRYPFDGAGGGGGGSSSELEFFRHRIHLERDSIKRAKESLRNQKSLFQQRQKELKLKHGSMARHTLQQLCQEEKELTDMEVSLHRTRSLLGEKVIRLRHLEQSLQRATLNPSAATTTTDQNKPAGEDTTLSDLSSHSASSGISSTEFATAENLILGKGVIRGEHFQESSEIIQSLENLNSEIREIWEVLYKQQQQSGGVTAVASFPFVYPSPSDFLGWPMLAGTAPSAPPSIPTLADRLHNYRQQVALANAHAQSTMVTQHATTQGATTTLVERTRNLRHWLRQAGVVESGSGEGNVAQANL